MDFASFKQLQASCSPSSKYFCRAKLASCLYSSHTQDDQALLRIAQQESKYYIVKCPTFHFRMQCLANGRGANAAASIEGIKQSQTASSEHVHLGIHTFLFTFSISVSADKMHLI